MKSGDASRFWRAEPRRVDEVVTVALSLVVRAAVVAWAHGRFPPADDGKFYHVVADRIAHGLGYTWQWPDGVVTYAAHYPVGYPALMGAGYAVFGSSPTVAMALNAFIGTLGVWAVYRLASFNRKRGPAVVAGVVAALHPSLVFYTPALMTEGVTAALLAVLGWLAVTARARGIGWLVALGLLSGVLVLVRPQALVLAPVLGAVAGVDGWPSRLRRAALVTVLALGVCLPWTLRNCSRLDHCAFVSANGGWNLFIGSAEKATGRWVSIDELGVPDECRNEFGEAGKDRCFGRAGTRNIREHPVHFLKLIPAKLSATFDWSGAPGHYLHSSNGALVDEHGKLQLGIAEALYQRIVLLLGFVGVGLAPGPRRGARMLAAALSAVWLFRPEAWLSHLLLVLLVASFGRSLWSRPAWLLGAAAVLATAVTHAVFFGAGRYGLVCVLLLVAFAAEGLAALGGGKRPFVEARRLAPSLLSFDSRSSGE
ncbi:MAG TPA: glycosyltransferase family 39 protein [Polyangiaceae bacterium]|nr:glycosyltransferase family 39 protein [Polyangiaceae bacterium]